MKTPFEELIEYIISNKHFNKRFTIFLDIFVLKEKRVSVIVYFENTESVQCCRGFYLRDNWEWTKETLTEYLDKVKYNLSKACEDIDMEYTWSKDGFIYV
jgi:hypothetical protein